MQLTRLLTQVHLLGNREERKENRVNETPEIVATFFVRTLITARMKQ